MAKCCGTYAGCTGECSRTCKVCSGGGCGGCTGGCTGGCKGGCSGGCSGSCTGGCSGGCKGSCTGCSGTCTGGCKGSCTGTCNFGCTSTAQVTIYNRLKNLGLHDFIEAGNVQDIINLSYNELSRRGKANVGYQDTLVQYVTLTLLSYFNHIQTNISEAGKTLTYTNTTNETILRAMAQELIDQSIALYEETIGRN